MKRALLPLAFALATLVTGAASAATVTFSGTVSSISGPSPVASGDRISGAIVLDDAATGAIVLDDAATGAPGSLVGTDYAITSYSLTLPSGRTDTLSVGGSVNVRNDCTTGCVQAGLAAVDGFSFGAASDATSFSTSTSLVLSGAATSVLPDEGLAGVIAFFDGGVVPSGISFGLDVTTFSGIDIYGNDCSAPICQFQARIDTIGVAEDTTNDVPLPAGLPLLLAGLGGLALLRRRR